MTQEEAENMSNEQAVKVLAPYRDAMRDRNGCPTSEAYFALDMAIKALESRKTGRWVGNPETCEFMICSVCGREFDWFSEGGISSYDWNFCPSCGAYMGGDEE